MKKKLLAHMVVVSIVLIGCGGGGSSNNGTQSAIPIQETPILSPQEKIEATHISQFFLNTITNESLNFGFIDRLLFAAQHTASTCPSAVLTTSAERKDLNSSTHHSKIFNPCSLAYPRANNFSIQEGSIEQTIMNQPLDVNLSQDHIFNFKNIVLNIDGKKFTIDGLVSRATLKNNDIVIFSKNLTVIPESQVQFVFSNFASTIKESATAITQQASGELKVLSEHPYQVKFSTPTYWHTLKNQPYPTQGQLTIEYAKDASRFLIVSANPHSHDVASYYVEVANNILFNHVSRPWSEIIISPSEYHLN